MTSKEVISMVDGLNSPTTLKRWVKQIYELTGITFRKHPSIVMILRTKM